MKKRNLKGYAFFALKRDYFIDVLLMLIWNIGLFLLLSNVKL